MTNKIKHDRFQILDIDPAVIIRKLIIKSDRSNISKEQSVIFSLIDFYQAYMDIEILEKEFVGVKFEVFDSLTEQASSVISALCGIGSCPKVKRISAIKYYNDFIESKLNFLKRGMGYLSVGEENTGEPIIIDFQVTKNSGLKLFKVTFELDNLIGGLKKFISDYKNLQDRMQKLWESSIQSNAPTIEKQGELFIKQVRIAQEKLGVHTVNIGMRDWGMRMTSFVLDDGGLCPHPFNMDYKGKSILPLYLEADGLIDIHDISLVNKVSDYSNANLQYSVRRPCIANVFDSDNTSIPMEHRKLLTETQVVIIEKVFESLNEACVFVGKPALKEHFMELIIWFIKKLSYCLEEESFLRNRAIEYIDKNSKSKYMKIEDDLFLPFLYEKLSDAFGTQKVIKKPKKFKGEIDILFGTLLPIELKVWRKKNKDFESTIDEKFPHTGQAATYASIERVGFLVILDISSVESGIKNIENCWRVITKEFDMNKQHSTKIVTLVFDCNHTTPSRL